MTLPPPAEHTEEHTMASRPARDTTATSTRDTPGESTGTTTPALQGISVRRPIGLPLPGIGTVQLSRAQLAYVGAVAALTVADLIAWPVGLALAAGHLLAAEHDNKTVLEEFGEALGVSTPTDH